jgi:hypothetical protein
MKNLLFAFVLAASGFKGIAQQVSASNSTCFTVPKEMKISELNNIQISNECMITSFSFQLFNRWGELKRVSNKMTNPLIFGDSESQVTDSKKKKKRKNTKLSILDKPLEQGVYFYIISYTLPGDSKTEKQTGNITFF